MVFPLVEGQPSITPYHVMNIKSTIQKFCMTFEKYFAGKKKSRGKRWDKKSNRKKQNELQGN